MSSLYQNGRLPTTEWVDLKDSSGVIAPGPLSTPLPMIMKDICLHSNYYSKPYIECIQFINTEAIALAFVLVLPKLSSKCLASYPAITQNVSPSERLVGK